MIFLGIGSNVGDRVGNIRRAIRALSSGPHPLVNNINVSPVYESQALVPQGAPDSWNKDFLNCVISGTSTLDIHALFSKLEDTEKKLGRLDSEPWAPRTIDIDILAFDDLEISNSTVTIPHPALHERPFVLLPLADIAPLWIHPKLRLSAQELRNQWTEKTPLKTMRSHQVASQIVGILNATPDSFSDGSIFNEPVNCTDRVRKMIAQGASVVDVGAESTRPGAQLLTPEEEWNRIEPFLAKMKSEIPELGKSVVWSLDTRHGRVAEKAQRYGVNWINDVSGLEEKYMRDFVKDSDCDVVVMHSLGIPPSKENVLSSSEDVTKTLVDWGLKKIESLISFISLDRIILDPGIGFGKSAIQAAALIKNSSHFRQWPCPVLIGHSRKSFLAYAADRDAETAVLTATLAESGIEFIRVHNVALNKQSLELSARQNGVFL